MPRRGRVPMNERTRAEQLRHTLELKLMTELLDRTRRRLVDRGWDDDRASTAANGLIAPEAP